MKTTKKIKQSKRHARKVITETDCGSLVISFPDENAAVLVRFIIQLGRRTIQIAVLDDIDDPHKAQVITGRAL